MIPIKFRIIGKWWTLRVLDKKTYNSKKFRKGSVAVTVIHKKRIDLSPKGCDKESIVHELVHSYFVEMCVHSSELDIPALEEFYCELMAKRGQELLDLAETLYQKVKAMRSAA